MARPRKGRTAPCAVEACSGTRSPGLYRGMRPMQRSTAGHSGVGSMHVQTTGSLTRTQTRPPELGSTRLQTLTRPPKSMRASVMSQRRPVVEIRSHGPRNGTNPQWGASSTSGTEMRCSPGWSRSMKLVVPMTARRSSLSMCKVLMMPKVWSSRPSTPEKSPAITAAVQPLERASVRHLSRSVDSCSSISFTMLPRLRYSSRARREAESKSPTTASGVRSPQASRSRSAEPSAQMWTSECAQRCRSRCGASGVFRSTMPQPASGGARASAGRSRKRLTQAQSTAGVMMFTSTGLAALIQRRNAITGLAECSG
mmetsp:Transcript_47319/g.133092  ORF Transcript_47319/g.133092 Transcript_47319/m.133092 type:complete len:312 (+) Transcript_47319:36-971(+)